MIQIEEKKIGDGCPCFIVFEAGPTHCGVESAKKLVHSAAEAGADAIKFQILDPDRLIYDKLRMFDYNVLVDRKTGKVEKVSEPLYDILCRRALKKEQWHDIKKYCDELGILFFATVGFYDEVDFLNEINCNSIKIASVDVNHYPLMRYVARKGIPIQMDTGNATISEIEMAVDVIQSEGYDDIIIHQCPSGYPAHLQSINLKMIKTLKQMFPFPIAFSDHTPGWDMDIAAVALGANLIEKTITLDKTTRSVEHIMSLEPDEMVYFVKAIRNLEIALGNNRRVMSQKQKYDRLIGRRSTYLAQSVKKGQKLSDVKIEFSRPGYGLGPDMYEKYVNATFRKDFQQGYQLEMNDLVL